MFIVVYIQENVLEKFAEYMGRAVKRCSSLDGRFRTGSSKLVLSPERTVVQSMVSAKWENSFVHNLESRVEVRATLCWIDNVMLF